MTGRFIDCLVERSGSKPIYGYRAALILLVIHTSVLVFNPSSNSIWRKRKAVIANFPECSHLKMMT